MYRGLFFCRFRHGQSSPELRLVAIAALQVQAQPDVAGGGSFNKWTSEAVAAIP